MNIRSTPLVASTDRPTCGATHRSGAGTPVVVVRYSVLTAAVMSMQHEELPQHELDAQLHPLSSDEAPVSGNAMASRISVTCRSSSLRSFNASPSNNVPSDSLAIGFGNMGSSCLG